MKVEKYESPIIEVIDIKLTHNIMAGSVEITNDDLNGFLDDSDVTINNARDYKLVEELRARGYTVVATKD